MAGRRVQYILLLLGAGTYYIASGEWLSWVLLVTALGLPWLSLLLSLPAILGFRAAPAGVDVLEQGEEAELWLLGSCRMPLPPFKGFLRVESCFTGKAWRYAPEQGLSTQHCGGYRVGVEKARICDYLGLFSFRARHTKEQTILVRPREEWAPDLPDPQRLELERWVPKPGGGFSENHEHRLYRPGDSLNQLHWKLSAKVGDLMIREPMEPVRGAVLLTLRLAGTPEELDRKLGRLLWVGRYLLGRELDFELRALTGAGVLSFPVDTELALQKAVDRLLCSPLAAPGEGWEESIGASWRYHIGGDAHEG